ncbi:MAG: DUF3105 domain-containing protein, partial [Chloroflexi bacterium]|nr:DUF3105 domain-containing protein [Chloroflexota bacterium]
ASHKWRNILLGGGAALGLLALSYMLYLSLQGPSPIQDLITYARQSRGHVETPIEAAGLPPAGGEHSGIWQNCGIYTSPVGTENVMHSLEHGAVWITYQPDLPEEDVTYLQDLVRRESSIVLSPYPGLKSPVVATAWEVQLELDSVDDGRLNDFIDRYQKGPTAPERLGACSNGVGTPLP